MTDQIEPSRPEDYASQTGSIGLLIARAGITDVELLQTAFDPCEQFTDSFD